MRLAEFTGFHPNTPRDLRVAVDMDSVVAVGEVISGIGDATSIIVSNRDEAILVKDKYDDVLKKIQGDNECRQRTSEPSG